jgi:hypothetical protein
VCFVCATVLYVRYGKNPRPGPKLYRILRTGVATSSGDVGAKVQVAIEGLVTVPSGTVQVNVYCVIVPYVTIRFLGKKKRENGTTVPGTVPGTVPDTVY